MDLNVIQMEMYATAVSHGWHEKEITFGEFISLCHSELSEALQEYRQGSSNEKINIELADVIIRILDYCEHNKINMEKLILEKNEINKNRTYRHGNKIL